MSAVLHRDFSKSLPTVVKGDGPYLIDHTGKRYIDASGGAAVSCLGHSHPKVISRIRHQVDEIAYAHTSFFTNTPSEALAQQMVERAPAGFGNGKATFVGSGSEAMEVALKLARQYFVEKGEPQRSRFIARQMAYHGNTLGALSVGGHMQRRHLYTPLLMDVVHVSACYAYRLQLPSETEGAFLDRLLEELDREIRHAGPENVAAFIVEPVSGATLGCALPIPGYFQGIRSICDRYGILLIADEVMCGMGRTGTLFALEQENITADIITVAKGLGAGYQAIAAVMAAQKVTDVLAEGSGKLANGHTYMSHAVACAGALAVLETIDEENLLPNVITQGSALKHQLEERFSEHPNVGDIRGRGLFLAIELVAERDTKAPFDAAIGLAASIKETAQENGLLCYPSSGCADGVNGDHILLAPPYIIDQRHVDEICDKLHSTLNTCLTKLHQDM